MFKARRRFIRGRGRGVGGLGIGRRPSSSSSCPSSSSPRHPSSSSTTVAALHRVARHSPGFSRGTGGYSKGPNGVGVGHDFSGVGTDRGSAATESLTGGVSGVSGVTLYFSPHHPCSLSVLRSRVLIFGLRLDVNRQSVSCLKDSDSAGLSGAVVWWIELGSVELSLTVVRGTLPIFL